MKQSGKGPDVDQQASAMRIPPAAQVTREQQHAVALRVAAKRDDDATTAECVQVLDALGLLDALLDRGGGDR